MNSTKKTDDLLSFRRRIQREINLLDSEIKELNHKKSVLIELIDKARSDTDILLQSSRKSSVNKAAVQNKIIALIKDNPPFLRSHEIYRQCLVLFPELKSSTLRTYTRDLKSRGFIEQANFTNGCWRLTVKGTD